MPAAGTTEHLRERQERYAIAPIAPIAPIAMRVPDACRYLGIGRSTLYVLIRDREVEIIKLGSSTLLLTDSLNALIERRRETAVRLGGATDQ